MQVSRTETLEPQPTPSLADLSRNASVISSSSSSSSVSDLTVQIPIRPRPQRTFSSPQRPLRSRSPQSPATPRGSRPPAYLARELGIAEDSDDSPTAPRPPEIQPAASRAQSKPRSSSVNGRGVSASDFKFGKQLGQGSYSTQVVFAKSVNTGEEFAVKVIDKGHLKRKDKTHIAQAERNTLVKLGSGHPGIVRLHSTFQDTWSLYFVLDLARNGELQSKISNLGSLSLACSRYYAAQIADTLEYMHSKGVLHRDLKPENVLLDDNFHIKICDFGTGKIMDSTERGETFVGTPQYVSPELLERNETSRSSDYWALGCIIFQMISGKFAFHGLSDYLTLEKIKKMEYSFPEGFDENAKDLVQKLLVRDPVQRLGAGPPGSTNDVQSLRSHPFFSSIDWSTLWSDPAPPLEAGLMKKEVGQVNGHPGSPWGDVTQAWDDMIEAEDDDIGWASDTGPTLAGYALNGSPAGTTLPDKLNGELVGPMGETKPYAFPTSPPIPDDSNPAVAASSTPVLSSQDIASSTPPNAPLIVSEKARDTPKPESEIDLEEVRDVVPATLDELPTGVRTQAIDVPVRSVRSSYSAGSVTSSSDGSPVSRLGAALEAADLERERGRNRAQTPIQGNKPPEEWTGVLGPGESVLYSDTVETSLLRRRASRILAIAVTPKRKSRELLLTDRRLICLKRKPNRPYVVRSEWVLSKPVNERDKEARHQIVNVEAKTDREFVVMTATKTHSFHTISAPATSTWVQKIGDALQSQPQATPAPQAISSGPSHSFFKRQDRSLSRITGHTSLSRSLDRT
ncbi:pkb-activating kinase-like protein [Steccherinum ochraceum]|uniref:non-specific serine/threonine protein kinase n=1 Tax=Steccherinum ochraceum TaxID=92696 RepID=A0A4R0RYD7_9APHY|nr:pkb-activating kinase-like protein [Steccherinum ochraceum]